MIPDGLYLPAVVISLVGLCVGGVIDYRTGRLPNWLTFSMMALGVAMWTSMSDPLFALKGLGLATAIHFGLFALSVERAGDAKLVMGASALMGWAWALEITVWYAALYLPVSVALLIWKGRMGNVVKVLKRQYEKPEAGGESPDLTYLRTGPIIAAAGFAATFTDWLDLA